MRLVSVEEARRIAVRAQLLDGSASGILETVRHLGVLQLDPIATVAPAQHLVLWSRLGSYDTAELDRLLWETRQLFEWNAYIWPIDDLPLVKGLIALRRRRVRYERDRWIRTFLAENRSFRRYVLRELGERGPLLSRELEDRSAGESRDHRWYGSRQVGLMLMSLHLYGEIAVAGRRGGQRLWDLAERWYPPARALAPKEAERKLAEKEFRSLGVRQGRDGWEAHAEATDGAVPEQVNLLSPFDRLIHDRDRAEALWGFRYRLEMYVPVSKREYGYYVLPILHADRVVGRLDPVLDRKTGVLAVKGVWAEKGAPADAGAGIAAALRELAEWLGATETRVGGRVPRAWAPALRDMSARATSLL